MRLERMESAVRPGWTMNEMKAEPLDFVRDFQEYLDQQTHHVTAMSPVTREKGEDLRTDACEAERSATDHRASIKVRLDADGFKRTGDGKFRCRYCSYASKGQARLIEHMRTHTGEKPYRCQLCPFSSACDRRLETHILSHTGEKPYKCELCPFRCNDRSNLSHHRRRRHKLRLQRNVASTQTKPKPFIEESTPLPLPQPAANQEQDHEDGLRPRSPHQATEGYEREVEVQDMTPPSQDPNPDTLLSPETSLAQINARALYHCLHCQTYFGDNVLYTLHMGCHGYDLPFQCHVCGVHCSDKYQFACHFAQGQHRK